MVEPEASVVVEAQASVVVEAQASAAEVQDSAAALVLLGVAVQPVALFQLRIFTQTILLRLRVSQAISFQHPLLQFKKRTTVQLLLTVTFRWSRATQLATKGWIPTIQFLNLTLAET